MERQKYDVAVSYASEQRPYVERFVARLQSQKMRVYYDRNAQAKKNSGSGIAQDLSSGIQLLHPVPVKRIC